MVNPVRVKIIPAMGTNGISGQAIRVTRPIIPVIDMTIMPAMSRKSLEKKPIHLEISRSVKAWNFVSREASLAAAPAEI